MAEQDVRALDAEEEEYWEIAAETVDKFLSTQLPPSAPPPDMPSSLSHSLDVHSAGQRKKIPARDHLISYSPPRVLSQRVGGGSSGALMDYSVTTAVADKPVSPASPIRRYDNEKDLEIDRLNKELERVSKKLLDLEQECSHLRKGENKGKGSTVYAPKIAILEPDVATSVNNREIDSTTVIDDKRGFKTTGVQTDLANHSEVSKKLLDIWYTSNYQDPRSNLVSELLLACSTDLQILFSFMKSTTPPQEVCKPIARTSANVDSSDTSESKKVYHLYSALTRISYGFTDLKTLVEPVLDLCKVENAILVHRSLHVLHVLMEHICGVEKRFEARDNITDEVASSWKTANFHGYKESSMKSQENTQRSWDAEWHSLFKLMNQIASTRAEENVKLEAVSIMNIIVMRTDAYSERENFVSTEVYESISLLLRKEAGLHVRKEAVHLFYLLLNCPKLLARFDSHNEERKSPASGNGGEENLVAVEAFGKIYEGLADCLTSPRKASEDLELCRNVIMILALVASSGNSGFELLSSHKLPHDTNFLMLILHLLVAEIDSESTEIHPKAEIFKARTLLMREILILLNRLVSGSSSSSTVLRELTKSRDMASLTVDAATRLSCKRKLLGQPESSVQRMRESEITDLARTFKRRIFAFLGDNT